MTLLGTIPPIYCLLRIKVSLHILIAVGCHVVFSVSAYSQNALKLATTTLSPLAPNNVIFIIFVNDCKV
jgi:hypothetical protein